MTAAAGCALGQRATVGVDGDAPIDQHTIVFGIPVLFEETAGVPRRAPAGVLDPTESDDRKSVIGQVNVDIVDPYVAHRLQSTDDHMLAVAAEARELILVVGSYEPGRG